MRARSLVAAVVALTSVALCDACSSGTDAERSAPSSTSTLILTPTADPGDDVDLNASVLEGSFVRRDLEVGERIDGFDLRAVLNAGFSNTETVRVEFTSPGAVWEQGSAETSYAEPGSVRTDVSLTDDDHKTQVEFLVLDKEYFVATGDRGFSRISAGSLDDYGLLDRRFWPMLASPASYSAFAAGLGAARYLGTADGEKDEVRRFATRSTEEIGFYLVADRIGAERDLELHLDRDGRLHEVIVRGDPEITVTLEGWGDPVDLEAPDEDDLVPLPGQSEA